MKFQSTPRKRGATDDTRDVLDYCKEFQSTPRKRGATNDVHASNQKQAISIHAPQARGDKSSGINGALH